MRGKNLSSESVVILFTGLFLFIIIYSIILKIQKKPIRLFKEPSIKKYYSLSIIGFVLLILQVYIDNLLKVLKIDISNIPIINKSILYIGCLLVILMFINVVYLNIKRKVLPDLILDTLPLATFCGVFCFGAMVFAIIAETIGII